MALRLPDIGMSPMARPSVVAAPHLSSPRAPVRVMHGPMKGVNGPQHLTFQKKEPKRTAATAKRLAPLPASQFRENPPPALLLRDFTPPTTPLKRTHKPTPPPRAEGQRFTPTPPSTPSKSAAQTHKPAPPAARPSPPAGARQNARRPAPPQAAQQVVQQAAEKIAQQQAVEQRVVVVHKPVVMMEEQKALVLTSPAQSFVGLNALALAAQKTGFAGHLDVILQASHLRWISEKSRMFKLMVAGVIFYHMGRCMSIYREAEATVRPKALPPVPTPHPIYSGLGMLHEACKQEPNLRALFVASHGNALDTFKEKLQDKWRVHQFTMAGLVFAHLGTLSKTLKKEERRMARMVMTPFGLLSLETPEGVRLYCQIRMYNVTTVGYCTFHLGRCMKFYEEAAASVTEAPRSLQDVCKSFSKSLVVPSNLVSSTPAARDLWIHMRRYKRNVEELVQSGMDARADLFRASRQQEPEAPRSLQDVCKTFSKSLVVPSNLVSSNPAARDLWIQMRRYKRGVEELIQTEMDTRAELFSSARQASQQAQVNAACDELQIATGAAIMWPPKMAVLSFVFWERTVRNMVHQHVGQQFALWDQMRNAVVARHIGRMCGSDA